MTITRQPVSPAVSLVELASLPLDTMMVMEVHDADKGAEIGTTQMPLSRVIRSLPQMIRACQTVSAMDGLDRVISLSRLVDEPDAGDDPAITGRQNLRRKARRVIHTNMHNTPKETTV